MDRVRHRKHKHREAADLDVTPFMNLMIVLVPVLLLSMVFTHTTVIDLNFPSGEGSEAAFDPDLVHLEVVVKREGFDVADGRGGTIKSVPKVDGVYDFEQLSLVMQEIKKRMPDKRDITVLLLEETSYQTLVSVMDKVRSYPTVQHLEVVQAELFPVVTLGDSPKPAGAKVAASRPASATSAEDGGRS
jgi:biopolymer transport protein ExbD